MALTTIEKPNKALGKANTGLKAIQPLVSNEMKMLLALDLKCTTRTIDTYLAGQGKKLPFALELLGLAKKKLRGVAV